jgi:hypothetical protein
MDDVELAQEGLEKTERHERAELAWTKYAAILIAVLAAIAVIVEMSGNDAQVAYLSHHVSVADTWAQYQGKSTRRVVLSEAADLLESAPGANQDQAVRARIDKARAEAARMQSDPDKGDGMEQLQRRARAEEHVRDHELERGARGLQIAVVLSGLAIVTGALWLFAVSGVLGAVATVYALLAGLSLV